MAMAMARVAMEAPAFLDEAGVSDLYRQWRLMLARASVDEKRFVEALEWLQARGEHGLVLDQTDLPELTQWGELMTLRLVSLIATGEHDAAAALASHPQAASIGVHPTVLEALEAYRVSPTREHLEGTLARLLSNLDRAPDAVAAFVAGAVALHVGAGEVAEAAHRLALQTDASWPVPAQPFLDAVRGADRSAREALGALLGVPRQGIASMALRKRIAYLRLLAGERIGVTEAQVQNLLKVAPADPYLRMLAALGRHLQGDAKEAMKYLVPLPQNRWHHGEAAVIAAMLAAGGDTDRPLKMMATLRVEGMLAEERAQMQPWLEKAMAVAAPVMVPLARNP